MIVSSVQACRSKPFCLLYLKSLLYPRTSVFSEITAMLQHLYGVPG